MGACCGAPLPRSPLIPISDAPISDAVTDLRGTPQVSRARIAAWASADTRPQYRAAKQFLWTGTARMIVAHESNSFATQEHSNAALYVELQLFYRVEERFDR
jgi:hypothetical protein